jgi:RNA polymerase sigma-70 factor, ECF subfamily
MISKKEFEKAYDDYYDKLYSYIAFRLDDAILAEDMVSQVFFKALRNLNSYDKTK